MAESGIRSSNLPLSYAPAEVVAHEDIGGGARRTVRSPITALANALVASAVKVTAGTAAQLNGMLGYAAGTGAEVVADANTSNNGVYQKTGNPGSGGWTRIADLRPGTPGPTGPSVEFQVASGTLQYRVFGTAIWTDLLSLTGLVAGKAAQEAVDAIQQALAALTTTVGTKASQAALDAALSHLARINAGLYPISRPGDNPTAFSNTAPSGDPDALAPLSTVDYPVRVVGDGLGVEVTGSREVWERRLHSIETGRLWRTRWRLTRTQNAQDPDGDAVERLIAWYGPDRTLLGLGRVGWETPLVAQGAREYAGFIGDAGATGVDIPRPQGAAYFRVGMKAYGNEARTVLTDLGAADVSDLRDAVLTLVPEDSIPELGARIDALIQGLSNEVADREAAVTTLGTRVDGLVGDLADEEGAREAADNFLSAADAAINLRINAINEVAASDASIRAAADVALNLRIDGVSTGVGDVYRTIVPRSTMMGGATAYPAPNGKAGMGWFIPAGQTGGTGTIVEFDTPLDLTSAGQLAGRTLEISLALFTSDNYSRDIEFGCKVFTASAIRNTTLTVVRNEQVSPSARMLKGTIGLAGDEIMVSPHIINATNATRSLDSFLSLSGMSFRVVATPASSASSAGSEGLILGLERSRIQAKTEALEELEWLLSYDRIYRIRPDGSGDFLSPALAITAINASLVKPTRTKRILLDARVDATFSDTNQILPDYVDMLGLGINRTILYAEMADNTPTAQIATTSILRAGPRSRLRGLSIWIKNGRFALESDSAGGGADAIVRMEDVDVRHFGNDGARAYQTANGGNAALVWNQEHAWNFVANSGQSWLIDRSSFISRNGAAILGQNTAIASRAIKVVARNTRIISQIRRAATTVGFSLRLDAHGSGQNDTFELIDCEMAGVIATTASPWLTTRPADQVANRNEWHISGSGNSPVPFIPYDDGARALRIVSNSTEPFSAVAAPTGSAVTALFGSVVRRPGGVGLQGDVYGAWDVGDHLVGGAFDLNLTSLGYRLGDCRTATKSLTITTDKASATVTFNQDHRAQSNATILAAINTAIGSVASASLLWVTELHRPTFRDQQAVIFNASATAIRRKRAVAYTGEDRSGRTMTPVDQAILFAGIAMEDIRPGEWGRIKTGGALNPDTDIERLTGTAMVLGTTLGVIDELGRFDVQSAYPLITAENAVDVRFLSREERSRTQIRPYASQTSIGDSITAGVGASVPAMMWSELLGRYLRVVPTNLGLGGSMTADRQPQAYAQTVTDTGAQLFTFATGTNEGLFNAPGETAKQATFSALHAAAVAWLAIPERNKLRGQRRAATIVVSSLTSNGAGIATATTSGNHGFVTGRAYTVTGAAPAAYNVTAPITVTGPTTFTYPIAGTPTTPATVGADAIRATSTDINLFGTWPNEATYYGGGMSVRSSTKDDYAFWKTFGDVAYFAYGVHTGNAGTFAVYVDDVLYGSYASSGPGGGMSETGIHKTNHGSCLVRLSGLGNRQHTVKIVVTSPTNGGDVWLDWVSTIPPGGATYLAGPTVAVGGTPQTQDPNFGGNLYATLARANVETLAGDGLNLVFVDTAAFMNFATDLTPDNIHPNDTGHGHIFEAYKAALDTSATARTKAAIGAIGGKASRRVVSLPGAPTAKDLPSQEWGVFEDTIGGGVSAWFNKNGTMIKFLASTGGGGSEAPDNSGWTVP